jgi:hypothetical protein
MHPLGSSLANLKDEELHQKYGELSKRLNQCFRSGPQSVIPQLQMLMGDYQEEIQRRNQKVMDDLLKKQDKDGGFKGVIDIS